MYRHDLAEYEEVEAMRFSDWLRENDLDMDKRVCLLRMNIEGAEFDVISDLVDSGLAKHIDGYFGMWDDASRIDKRRDDEFCAFLARHHISSLTFNGRDLRFGFRMRCIEYDMNAALMAGLRRIREGAKRNQAVETVEKLR